MPKYKRAGHLMTEQRFAQIKSLIDMKLKNIQIQDILKISGGTLCAVKRNKDFAAYKTEQKSYFDSKKIRLPISPKIIETKPVSEFPIYDVLVEIRDEVKDLNAFLRAAGNSKKLRLW